MLGEYVSETRDPVRELELLQYCESAGDSYAARRNRSKMVSMLIDYLETHDLEPEEWVRVHALLGEEIDGLEEENFSEEEDDDLDTDALIESILAEHTADEE
jgi:hypothetical protein